MTDLDDLIEEAVTAAFRGWDFTWLRGRSDDPKTPWRYTELVRDALAASRSALDIDTGGGESLAAGAPFDGFVVATEGYPPNIPVAGANLEAVGVPAGRRRSRARQNRTAGCDARRHRQSPALPRRLFRPRLEPVLLLLSERARARAAPRWHVPHAAAGRGGRRAASSVRPSGSCRTRLRCRRCGRPTRGRRVRDPSRGGV